MDKKDLYDANASGNVRSERRHGDTRRVTEQVVVGPTKITRIVRMQLDRIERLFEEGYTWEAVQILLGNETGKEIKRSTFQKALTAARAARDKSVGQTPVGRPGQVDHASERPQLPEKPAIESAPATGWTPARKVNPHLLALKKKQDRDQGG